MPGVARASSSRIRERSAASRASLSRSISQPHREQLREQFGRGVQLEAWRGAACVMRSEIRRPARHRASPARACVEAKPLLARARQSLGRRRRAAARGAVESLVGSCGKIGTGAARAVGDACRQIALSARRRRAGTARRAAAVGASIRPTSSVTRSKPVSARMRRAAAVEQRLAAALGEPVDQPADRRRTPRQAVGRGSARLRAITRPSLMLEGDVEASAGRRSAGRG